MPVIRGPVPVMRGHSQTALPPSPGVDISMDRTELDRRTEEARIRQSMGAFEASSTGEHDDMDDDNYDANSARFGDESPHRRHDYRGVRIEDDDGESLHIPLQSARKPAVNAHARDVTDDLSSLSFSRTLSPRRPSPPPIVGHTTYDSPVSGFEGMARELRKEFERLAAGTSRTPARSTLSPAANRSGRNFGSVDLDDQPGRRIFGEIGNANAPSVRDQPTAVPLEKTWSLPPVPSRSVVEPPAPLPTYREPVSAPYRPSQVPRGPIEQPVRPTAPTRSTVPMVRPRPQPARTHYDLPDVTGLTEGLLSPVKPAGHRQLSATILENAAAKADEGNAMLSDALNNLQDRLSNLEHSNEQAADRVREFESQLADHDSGFGGSGGSAGVERDEPMLKDAPSLKTWMQEERHARRELESLVHRLRAHVERLARSLRTNAEAINDLRRGHRTTTELDHVALLREAVDILSGEVNEVREVVGELEVERDTGVPAASERTRPLPPRSPARAGYVAREDLDHYLHRPTQRPPSRPRSQAQDRCSPPLRPSSNLLSPEIRTAPLHRVPSPQPTSRNPHSPHSGNSNRLRRQESEDLERELRRAETILSSVPRDHQTWACTLCQRRKAGRTTDPRPTRSSARSGRSPVLEAEDEGYVAEDDADLRKGLPPQTVLTRVLRGLEDDFAQHRSIFVELSDSYKAMDPADNASKRSLLAEHLKESIDVLEQKADQIKRLYDMLHYRDQGNPVPTFSNGGVQRCRSPSALATAILSYLVFLKKSVVSGCGVRIPFDARANFNLLLGEPGEVLFLHKRWVSWFGSRGKMPRLLTVYGLASTALVGWILLDAFRQRSNFFSAAIHLSKSHACMLILWNWGIFIAVLFGKLYQWVCFGALRLIEIERLSERGWYALTETLLALTTFRDDFNTTFMILFVALLFLKIFHWLVMDRVEMMEQSANLSLLFHLRMHLVFTTLLLADLTFVFYVTECILLEGPSMMIMFALEFFVLLASLLSTGAKYVINCADHHGRHPLELKSLYMSYIDLVTDFVKLVIYLVFFSLIFTFYGVPLHTVRDVYITGRNFFVRVRDIIRYRAATKSMDVNCPDVTFAEMELVTDKTCIICREDMVVPPPTATTIGNAEAVPAAGAAPTPAPVTANRPQQNDRPKRLQCGHIFHFNCLRSWLERQQACPTCRRSILKPNAPAARPNQPPAPPAAGAAPAPPPPQPGAVPVPAARARPTPALTPAPAAEAPNEADNLMNRLFPANGQPPVAAPLRRPVPTPTQAPGVTLNRSRNGGSANFASSLRYPNPLQSNGLRPTLFDNAKSPLVQFRMPVTPISKPTVNGAESPPRPTTSRARKVSSELISKSSIDPPALSADPAEANPVSASTSALDPPVVPHEVPLPPSRNPSQLNFIPRLDLKPLTSKMSAAEQKEILLEQLAAIDQVEQSIHNLRMKSRRLLDLQSRIEIEASPDLTSEGKGKEGIEGIHVA